MAYIEPNSDVILLARVPLDPSYENTLYFSSLSEQSSYFRTSNNFRRLAFSKYSYARKSRNRIKVEIDTAYTSLINYTEFNYMMFKNTSFENKWFYAFITNSEYVNNNTVVYTFELDVLQSWFFDYDFNECLIEREHTATDEVGEHIIEENLDTGEFVYYQPHFERIVPVIVMFTTVAWSSQQNKFITPDGAVIDGRESANLDTGQYYIPLWYYHADPTNSAEVTALQHTIDFFTEKNKINAIVSIFMGDARVFTPTTDPETGLPNPIPDITIYSNAYLHKIGDYTVHNNKLFTYPYYFIQASNLQGDVIDFKWEYFTNKAQAVFSQWGNKSLTPGLLMYANNYKGLSENLEEIISINNFPQCAFNNDTYKAWLAQNRGALTAAQIGIASSLVVGAAKAAGGAPQVMATDTTPTGGFMAGEEKAGSGGSYSTLVGGLTAAAGLLGRMYDMSTLPPTRHGNGNGDLLYQASMCGFFISKKGITEQYLDRIDKFFSMYGYKVCRVGKPHINSRPCYNYVKTVGCSLKPKATAELVETAEVPAEDARLIEAIYNKGVRFWKLFVDENTPVVFGSYDWSVNNNAPVFTGNQTPASGNNDTPVSDDDDNQGGE